MPLAEDINGFKVSFAQRCHSPPGAISDHLHGTRMVQQAPHEDNFATFVAGDRGRKRFESKYSSEEGYRQGKKTVTPPRRQEGEKKEGKRFIPHPTTGQEITSKQRKHLEPLQPALANARGLPAANWMRKKIVTSEDGTPVSIREPKMYDLEVSMNRKQRVSSPLDQRNLIPAASAGDKSYKEADREPGFYAQGGLVVGSTNTLKPSAKPTLRKSEDTANKSGGKTLEATYGKMKARLALQDDLQQVRALTVSSWVWIYIRAYVYEYVHIVHVNTI
ncbi:hypothetical protein EON65_00920 [archaeon]|nr:MAG: hypothetical protein EON65_00920 [archaeon]